MGGNGGARYPLAALGRARSCCQHIVIAIMVTVARAARIPRRRGETQRTPWPIAPHEVLTRGQIRIVDRELLQTFATWQTVRCRVATMAPTAMAARYIPTCWRDRQ
jgi:hypothetical protein